MRLTAEVVIKLSQLRAKITALQAEEEQLCNDVKDRMIERGIDAFAPRSIPLKLVKLEYEQIKDGFYEKMTKKAFRKLHGPRWEMELERERDKYPKREVVALRVVAGNERYQQPKAA